MTVFYIGGSPCSGKSTVAERLGSRFDLTSFKIDDRLGVYMKEGAARGFPATARFMTLSDDENWMRPPDVQCREELTLYHEMDPLIRRDLEQISQRAEALGYAVIRVDGRQAPDLIADQISALFLLS